MSTVVSLCIQSNAANFSSLTSAGLSLGMMCITEGLKELNYSYEKDKEILNCDNEIVKVKLLIKTLECKEIGVVEENGGCSFVTTDLKDEIALAAIKKIRQRYSKHMILHEMKSKGYSKIKEEKLANGKIRIVVEKNV